MRSVCLPGRPIRAGVLFLALFAGAASSAFSQTVLLYVANFNSNSVTEFSIPNPSTGALVGFPPKTTNRNPYDVAVTPNGKYLYVGENGAIEVFAIDSNGNASAPPAATITGNVAGMKINTAGTFLFVSNSSANPPQVETYSIDQTNGQISLVSSYQVASTSPPTPALIRDLEIDGSNHLFLSVTNSGNNTGYVQVFNIAGNGSISPISGTSTFSTGGALGPNRLAFNASKTLLFTANQFDASITAMSVAGSGALSVAGGPLSTGSGWLPLGIAVDPAANVVAVVNGVGSSNNLRVYTFSNAGVLTFAGAYTVGNQPTGVTIDPTGSNLYVSNTADNSVTRFSVNSSGVLSSPFTQTTGGLSPQFLLARFPPAPVVTATVPTVSTWALVVLGALLAAASMLAYRRTARQS